MTDRQRAFLAAYLGGRRRNATKAAAAAGYAWPDKQGPRLTHFPEIAAAIRVDDKRRSLEWQAAYEKACAEREAEKKRRLKSAPPKRVRGRYRRRRSM